MRQMMIIAVVLFAATGVQAQTSTSSVAPKFLDGTLSACEVVFDAYLHDTAYLSGAPVHVAGSWAIQIIPERGLWGMLKLGVTPSPSAQAETIAPANAYVIVDYSSNIADQKFGIDSDTPGFRLFGFDASGDATQRAIVAPANGRFTVAYTFAGGRLPTTFPIEVEDADAAAYSECLSALIADREAE